MVVITLVLGDGAVNSVCLVGLLAISLPWQPMPSGGMLFNQGCRKFPRCFA